MSDPLVPSVLCWIIHQSGVVVGHGYCDAGHLELQQVPVGAARLELDRSTYEALRVNPDAYEVVAGEVVPRASAANPLALRPPWAG